MPDFDTTGINIISEMSKDALIDEILATQFRILNNMDTEILKRYVIHFRLTMMRHRLFMEAGFDVPPFPLLELFDSNKEWYEETNE